MPYRLNPARTSVAFACIVSLLCAYLPRPSLGAQSRMQRALRLLNATTCAQQVAQLQPSPATPAPSPSAGVSPSPAPTPTFGPVQSGAASLYATPRPQSPVVTPPPVPTPTPNTSGANAPIFLVRGGSTPPPIPPAGAPPPSPTPVPSAVPTLGPGNIAILADKIVGNTGPGHPGDAIGNVHIFYAQEELVGQRAHYDGLRTVTVTGHPYVINHAHDSILQAHKIIFDTISQTVRLIGGSGESDEGVQHGLVHFRAKQLRSDSSGVAHGTHAFVTTCENSRGGYHITGKTIDVYPADKIVITDAILWLGAAAVFFLPRVVIPLRQVVNETRRPSFFPVVGYDQYEGAYVKARLSFGKNQYYYGYYRVNYFTKVGLGLGYVGFYAKQNGRRTASLNFYGIHDRRSSTTTYNVNAQEQENFSPRLRGNFNFTYQGNYGPLTNIPPNSGFNASIVHSGLRESQNYTFSRSAVGQQSSSDTFAFTDQHQFTNNLSQAINFSMSRSQNSYGGVSTQNASAHFTSLTHLTTKNDDYQLTFDKTFSQQPFGINKLPELQIRPYRFFAHAPIPITAQFTLGQYSEPSNRFNTSRANLVFGLGPALYKVFGSDFSAAVNVTQDAYGTGDLKAAIQQNLSLTTSLGKHIVNAITYNEANYNGPPFVPFQYLDQQPTQNIKGAQDLLRFFNGDVYTLTLGFATSFNALAQPVTYQLTSRPSARSLLMLGGSFVPGIGQGFTPSTIQFVTPFGRDTTLQFLGTLDWKNKGRIENKTIYLSKIIGNCYEVQLQYNQASRQVNVALNLLAFPSQTANFGIGHNGPIIPSTFNGF
ncbi:MAG: hypothetical protein ACYDA5_05465 [Vulcanimicrobiaceae bacterium]